MAHALDPFLNNGALISPSWWLTSVHTSTLVSGARGLHHHLVRRARGQARSRDPSLALTDGSALRHAVSPLITSVAGHYPGMSPTRLSRVNRALLQISGLPLPQRPFTSPRVGPAFPAALHPVVHRFGGCVASSRLICTSCRGPCSRCHTRLWHGPHRCTLADVAYPNQRICRTLGSTAARLAVGRTAVPRGQPKAASPGCAVRLSTFPHTRPSTAIQWLTCASCKISSQIRAQDRHAARRQRDKAGTLAPRWLRARGT